MIFALAAAVVLSAIALLHVAWALGVRWPGTDRESLARTVVGGPPGMRMQGPVACLAVAVLLGLAAFLVLAAAGVVPAPLPPTLVRIGAWGATAVLGVRGAGGFFDTRLRPAIRGSRYARLNVVLYSPLCLALAALMLLASFSATP